MKRFAVTRARLPSGAVRVALRGELDLTHAYTLDEEQRGVEQRRPPCIIVDLRELSFISACGVSRLLAARRRARRAGWRLVLVRGRAIAPLLTLTALEQTFEVVNDVPTLVPGSRRVASQPWPGRPSSPPGSLPKTIFYLEKTDQGRVGPPGARAPLLQRPSRDRSWTGEICGDALRVGDQRRHLHRRRAPNASLPTRGSLSCAGEFAHKRAGRDGRDG